MEGQERNTAQLEKIGATMEQKWGSEEKNRKKESRDNEEGSENSSGKSQEEETPLSASC